MKLKSNNYSYSKLQTYKNCPQKYKLTYIDKIKYEEDSIEAFIGKMVHETLEEIYSLGKDNLSFISFDIIEGKYNEIWKRNFHDKLYLAYCKIKYKKLSDRKKYTISWFKAQGLSYLRSYYMNNGTDFSKTDVVGIEEKIEFKIENYNIIGYIDRLDKNNNTLIINDYKTGKLNKKHKIKEDLQAFIYFYGLRSIYDTDNIKFHWHYLQNGYNRVELDFQEDVLINNIGYIDLMKNNILLIINEIEKLEKDRSEFIAKPSMLCEWCFLWKNCSEKKDEIFPSIKL